jgi:TPR repeat protein
MTHPLRLGAVFGAAVLACAAAAAPPAGGVQGELDRAVLDYESGRVDAARAAFESLALRGVPAALYDLAAMDLRGELPDHDPVRTERLLTRAAEAGFVTAQFALGRAYENGLFGGRDITLANRWYERAAGGGSVDAQVAMGTAFYLGRGAPKDAALAAHWYREAASGGDVGAQYLLASMYEHGDGVERNPRLARYWYEAAARNGDAAAPLKVRELDAKAATTQPP